MAELTREQNNERMRKQLLHSAAKMFLEKGYQATSLRELCADAKVNVGSFVNLFGCKENIMRDLVQYVLEEQFTRTAKLLEGKTNDKILFYAAETTLQLYIAESSEPVREVYAVAYSLPTTTDIIQHTITGKLENIFKEHLPHLETKDFYELEIASGGIIRGFMTIPCDMYFTMERKVHRFIETSFLIYRLPDEKIQEAIDFVSQFDFKKIADETIASMLAYLEGK